MYNFGLICWVGIIVIAIAIFIAEVLCKSQREGPVLIVREEGETILPCTEDRFGGDDTPYTSRSKYEKALSAPYIAGPQGMRGVPGLVGQRLCKKCGKKIRNDRWFCSMKCKRAYLKGRK
jgi:hypothetical protein